MLYAIIIIAPTGLFKAYIDDNYTTMLSGDTSSIGICKQVSHNETKLTWVSGNFLDDIK